MINVRSIANGAIQAINPNIVAPFYANTGPSAPNAAGRITPTFAAPVNTTIQVQAAKASMLEHFEGLNMQAVYRNVRMWGNSQGVVRVNQQGGDMLQFPETIGGPVRWWKVEGVLETWANSLGWCSLLVSLQTQGPV